MSKSNTPPDPRDWDDEQIDALLARLEERVDTDTELGQAVKSRRRDVLKAIGAVGAGGLAGAAGMEAATGAARADPKSTQQGTIGNGDEDADLQDIDANHLDATSVQTGQSAIDGFGFRPRFGQLAAANRIRMRAGVPRNATVGPESNVTVGLSDAGALSSSGKVSIGNDSDASSLASSGIGTKDDPYIIRDLDIDGGGGTTVAGLDWDDPDSSYHIIFRNIEVHGWDIQNVYVNIGSDSTVKFENCKIYADQGNNAAALVWFQSGVPYIELGRCLLAGTGGQVFDARNGGTGEFVVRNTRIDDSETGNISKVVREADVDLVKWRHVEVSPSTQASNSCFDIANNSDTMGTLDMERCLIQNCERVTDQINNRGVGSGTRVVASRFTDMEDEALALTAKDEPGYEPPIVADCEFQNIGRRKVAIWAGKYDYEEYHEAGKKAIWRCVAEDAATAVSDGSAGGEPFELFDCTNGWIGGCYVEEAVEDAFEVTGQGFGGGVVDCVVDDPACDEAVDINYGASNGSAVVKRIYGQCGGEGVRLAGVQDGVVADVYLTVTGNSSDGAGSLINTKDSCQDVLITGMLPPVTQVDGGLFNFDSTDTRVAARYLDSSGVYQSAGGSLPTWADDTLR